MSYLMSLFCQNTDELQAGTERNVLRMLEAVLEASAVVIVDLILVLGIDILAADLLEGEGIDHERHVPEVGLHEASAAHICHLVSDLHLAIAMCALAVAAPQVDRDVGAADIFVYNVLVQDKCRCSALSFVII